MICVLNQFVVVGRIKEFIQEKDNKTTIVLEVPRNFKNELGKYDSDILSFEVSGLIATSAIENCKIQDIVGVKGRIQSDVDNVMRLIAEKVTFLSTNNKEE